MRNRAKTGKGRQGRERVIRIFFFAVALASITTLFLTAFFYLGKLIEADLTETLFTRPKLEQTSDYITGRFG